MRDPKRIEQIVQLLLMVWQEHPDYRLGQLLSNLLGPGRHDLFFVEDTKWEKLLREEIVNGTQRPF